MNVLAMGFGGTYVLNQLKDIASNEDNVRIHLTHMRHPISLLPTRPPPPPKTKKTITLPNNQDLLFPYTWC